MVPMKSGIIDTDYVQIFTLYRPSEKRTTQIMNACAQQISYTKIFTDNKKKDTQRVRVHTLTDGAEYNLIQSIYSCLYMNSIFLIHGESFSELEQKSRKFTGALQDQGIFCYQHTNSIKEDYISIFPGNAYFGNHFFMGTQEFVHRLVGRILFL